MTDKPFPRLSGGLLQAARWHLQMSNVARAHQPNRTPHVTAENGPILFFLGSDTRGSGSPLPSWGPYCKTQELKT